MKLLKVRIASALLLTATFVGALAALAPMAQAAVVDSAIWASYMRPSMAHTQGITALKATTIMNGSGYAEASATVVVRPPDRYTSVLQESLTSPVRDVLEQDADSLSSLLMQLWSQTAPSSLGGYRTGGSEDKQGPDGNVRTLKVVLESDAKTGTSATGWFAQSLGLVSYETHDKVAGHHFYARLIAYGAPAGMLVPTQPAATASTGAAAAPADTSSAAQPTATGPTVTPAAPAATPTSTATPAVTPAADDTKAAPAAASTKAADTSKAAPASATAAATAKPTATTAVGSTTAKGLLSKKTRTYEVGLGNAYGAGLIFHDGLGYPTSALGLGSVGYTSLGLDYRLILNIPKEARIAAALDAAQKAAPTASAADVAAAAAKSVRPKAFVYAQGIAGFPGYVGVGGGALIPVLEQLPVVGGHLLGDVGAGLAIGNTSWYSDVRGLDPYLNLGLIYTF